MRPGYHGYQSLLVLAEGPVKGMVKGWAGALLLILVVPAIAVLIWSPSPLERDTARDLPWELPDYRLARTSWGIDPQGKIHTRVEHFFLKGISPDMVAWFYQQLPISTIDYRGATYPLYHIFHPTEHGTLRVLQSAPDGTPGMAAGALISRDEWFGPYDSRGTARITSRKLLMLVKVRER